jgi:hypothetical protein
MRGSVVVRAGDEWNPATLVDVALTWLPTEPAPLTTRRRLQVFHGTTEVAATCVLLEEHRIESGGRGYVQLRLDTPVLAMAGDRMVLRSADRRTVGGAVVVDPSAPRHGRAARVGDRLRAIEAGETPTPDRAVEPRPSPSRPQVPVHSEGDLAPIAELVAAGGLRPPAPPEIAGALNLSEAEVLRRLAALAAAGSVVHVGEVWFARPALDEATTRAVAALREGPLGIGELRDLWGVGRRHALAVAAHMDREGITLRRGEQRALRRSARA